MCKGVIPMREFFLCSERKRGRGLDFPLACIAGFERWVFFDTDVDRTVFIDVGDFRVRQFETMAAIVGLHGFSDGIEILFTLLLPQ